MKYINKIQRNQKSVQSAHPCKSPPEWRSRAGVIQTNYDIVKAHGGEIKVNTVENKGTEFIIQLPII